MKKFSRPRRGRIIAGVCAGIAHYFGIPVTFVRFVWFLLLLPGGLPGFVPYIVLWLITPVEEKVKEPIAVL
jgi:phage shock protein C